MLSVAAAVPIFSGAWDHRPPVPSPLSSSPIRASSPLSLVDKNTLPHRHTQSSPIQPPKFKFASRPTRPNPVMRRREDTQEYRRKNFLQSVRQKSEDKAWQRRDIEGQLLKTSLLADIEQLSRNAPAFSEADIEDAMAFQEDVSQQQQQSSYDHDMMVDDFMEEDDIDDMVASYEEAMKHEEHRPSSPAFSDPDYDDVFQQLLAQEQGQQYAAKIYPARHMDVVEDDSNAMSY